LPHDGHGRGPPSAAALRALPVHCASSSAPRADDASFPPEQSMSHAAAPRRANRLAVEQSPYLLQHRYNPVDWYPWGEEAFARAARENRPIFLSIGYSTCHWCHVMERESFEDERIADFLNAHFVCIKVDREERPDVDKIYMGFLQATSRSGGWPLSAFLTPDRRPFFAGTYWPPEPRHGRPSFLQVIDQIADTWRDHREDVLASAAEIHARLAELTAREHADGPALTEASLAAVLPALKEDYDNAHGGFGGAPKFPLPTHPSLLLRLGLREGDVEAVRMVLDTCTKMAEGGIHDQVGGGFARYAVDAAWKVPHFEKMLYDNALLLELYLDCHLVGGDPRHADVVRDIVGYVLRDMTQAEGFFLSAEDADSEGKEGKFYCWTREELLRVLEPDEFALAERVYAITAAGNFVDHSDPDPLRGLNVLAVASPPRDAQEAAALEKLRAKLFRARATRVRPHRDDKVLAAWNGLMLAALARAAASFEQPAWRAAAIANHAFVRERLWDGDTGVLHARWRNGERDATPLCVAYAGVLYGLVELYQATLDPTQLDFAIAIADALIARFFDAEHGGFWQSAADAADLILRVKDDHDGAEPSGNSLATLALAKLAAITDRSDYAAAAERTLALFAGQMMQMPRAMSCLWQAAAFTLTPTLRVVVAGDPEAADTQALLAAVHDVYRPFSVVLGTRGSVESFARTLQPIDGRATAYLCTGAACQPPTQDAETLKQMLIAHVTEGDAGH